MARLTLSKVPVVTTGPRRLRPFACRLAWLTVVFLVSGGAASAQSVFTSRPDDPSAIHLAAPEFPVRGDGTADDTAAIQAAIDKAGSSFSGGLVFIPSGRYRLTRTVYLWRGVRLVGYGATRPVFVLGDETPGFQQGIGVMVMFTGGGPVGPAHRRRAAACRFRRPAASRRTSGLPTPTRARSIRA